MLCARGTTRCHGQICSHARLVSSPLCVCTAVSQHPPWQPGYPCLDVGCIPLLACCGSGSPRSSTTTWWQKHTSLPACSALQCFMPCGSVASPVCTPSVSRQTGSPGMPVYTRVVLCGSVSHPFSHLPCPILCVSSCLSACCFLVVPQGDVGMMLHGSCVLALTSGGTGMGICTLAMSQ